MENIDIPNNDKLEVPMNRSRKYYLKCRSRMLSDPEYRENFLQKKRQCDLKYINKLKIKKDEDLEFKELIRERNRINQQKCRLRKKQNSQNVNI